jgi:hypothetical protein
MSRRSRASFGFAPRLLVAAVAWSLGPAAAWAQTTVADLRQAQERALEPTRTLQAVPAALSAPHALPVPEVTLQTTKNGTDATAVIGVTNPFWGFRATFRTPIGKEDDAEASPLSLGGLANQASVDLAFIRTRVFKRSLRQPGQDIDALRLAFCAEHHVEPHKCSDQQFTGAEREQFLDYGIHRRPGIFTAHVQFGGKSFDYVERGTAAKVNAAFTSVAGGASYAWLFLEQQSVVAVGLDAAHDYAASRDTTLLCQPLATDVPGTTRCDTRTIGKPASSRKLTGSLEYRHVFTTLDDHGQSRPVVGLSLQAIVRAVDGGETVWGVMAPVYFLQKKPEQNKSAGLNGGAAVGWDSSNGVTARVFVGAAFALIAKGFNQ